MRYLSASFQIKTLTHSKPYLSLKSPPPHLRRVTSSMAAPPPSRSTTPPLLKNNNNNEVGISRRLWNKFRNGSIFSLFSPFVLSLASSSLRLDTFRLYLSQDVHFLNAFAKAYEMAEEWADDDEGKIAISELRKSVLDELKLHHSYVQPHVAAAFWTYLPFVWTYLSYIKEEWGGEIGKESSPNSATVKYTDFLLSTASGKVEGLKGVGKIATPFEKTKIAAYTLGATTPCMKLYAFIGKELQALLDVEYNTHPYKKWIDNYSSEGFQASALQSEELLDKLSVSLTGEELNIIEKLYQQAMKLEIEFFSAQSLSQPTVAPLSKQLNSEEWRLMLFSDFDLTCTVVDSSAILAEIAIVTAPKTDHDSPQGQIARMPFVDLRNTWGVLSRQYTEEYELCIERVLATKEGKEGEFDYEDLQKSLELLCEFEKKANTRVIESGVLKGINLEDIKKAGERLNLQDGCTSFFQNVLRSENLDVNVHVLSYCWCGDLIRSAFHSEKNFMSEWKENHMKEDDGKPRITSVSFKGVRIQYTGGLQALNIHANEFNYNESISTGEIDTRVESPIEKVQTFNKILNKCDNNKKTLSVYIGDSIGDLLCLLKADIGIVVGSSSSLIRVGTHFGVTFVPLFKGLVNKQKDFVDVNSFKETTQLGLLYTASSWAEIHAFILGP